MGPPVSLVVMGHHGRVAERRTATGRHRIRVALIAVIAWWFAAAFAVAAWALLDRAMSSDDASTPAMVGTWLIGLAALASVIGWASSIGSVVRDRGRIRIGALCLLVLPVLGVATALFAVSSTVERSNDPLAALWLLFSGLLLITGTLLIVPPEHLGTG
ncbi:hypothetical protein GCM10009785_06030 [Brooklawnia cerclae]|uniref:ABC-type transport system involved in cytochrome c biogenesis permease component n=1 Tax=Brooklawnia cerclae TaxID=349934 RepID=A0ABX0SBP2_9ACTN|nr:hypothetical protein [Brooklawnia cerclae]NIH55803.1 ABC-type transport system involved in cytochrome c biogenesis permease component [Brooklawnia cerclae]